MNFPQLPDLEQTVGDLVLDLLRARFEYPEHILSAPLDARGEISPNAVRVTQHYTTALLAYGFTSEQEELREAADWFASPFPSEAHRRIDAVEMNRLEALLSLRPDDPWVMPRLEQLALQRTANQYFDIQAGDLAFDTLWAVKVMALARQVSVLNGLVPEDDLRQWATRVVRDNHRDKDLALALRLRHELLGRLTPTQQKKVLGGLLEIADQSGGVWGLSRDMFAIGDLLNRQQLTFDQIADHREIFREMILSTCYVIENLMPLADSYADVDMKSRLQRAMELWWGVFHGDKAVNVLRALFPNPYDYLLIVCRTLVSLRYYLGAPLIHWGAAYIHRRMASQQIRQVESPDTESIKQALKNWIQVDLERAPEQLRLGMSDSNIVRIRPRICNPLQPEDDSFRLHIPNADSLIVKYGPIGEIEAERENYSRLPGAIRECFVNIPQPSYVDEQRRRAFVIMADLNRYRTLSDALQKVPQIADALINELGSFLIRVHQGDGRQRRFIQEGLLWQLYLMPMQQHIQRVFGFITENRLLEAEDKQKYATDLQRDLLQLIGKLVRYQLELENFPIACMHGDLHSRNVMVRRLKPRENPERDSELDFKLIDLEKFKRNGDAALDAGEILVDLELLRAPRNVPVDRDPIVMLMNALRDTYQRFAREREDKIFPIRLSLAQARSFIRIAKGRTKQGEVALRESRRGQAIRIAYDALDDTQQALEHLRTGLAALD